MESVPDNIGITEVRHLLKTLGKEAEDGERQLVDAARRIVLDEELIDALLLRCEELDTDFHRVAYSAKSVVDKADTFRGRLEEVSSELVMLDSDLPLLTNGHAISAQTSTDPEEVYRRLELLCQRHAFLASDFRHVEGRAGLTNVVEKDLDGTDSSNSSQPQPSASSTHPPSHPVSEALVKLSEGKILQEQLEWQLSDIQDRMNAMKSSSKFS